MANKVTLTFAGESSGATKALSEVGQASTSMSGTVTGAFDRMASGATFLTEGLANLGDSMTTIKDLSRASAVRADDLARKQLDIAQAVQDAKQAFQDGQEAILDYDQAGRDLSQAGIDVEQAVLDQQVAQKELNKVIGEFGPNSLEARQAQIDLKQAVEDQAQAMQDADEANIDLDQSQLDLSQSAIDAKDATVSLNEAQRAAIPSTALETWVTSVSTLAPLLFTAVGAVQAFNAAALGSKIAAGASAVAAGAWTAAQWLLNVALTANPIGAIIVAVAALIAVIVLIATKTTFFQDVWKAVWTAVKRDASNVWDWLKGLPAQLQTVWSKIATFISAPFKAGFNAVSRAWNNTVGKLSWSVPAWVPLIGGNHISAPKLPSFHRGGVVPGVPGQEVLAVLQAGETVTPAGHGGAGQSVPLTMPGGTGLDRIFLTWLEELLRRNRLRLVVAA